MPSPCVQTHGINGLEAWQKTANRKRRDRESVLAEYPDWRSRNNVDEHTKDVSQLVFLELSPKELEIVQHDASSLLDCIRERRFTCLAVINAYCHAASVAQGLTNCLTEIFFAEAIQRAKELDEHMNRTGSVIGPLHGLPVSVKDHVKVKGKDTSAGYIAWCYKTIAEKDAVAVDILRKAGAILYVKTNNPQTLLSLETNNNIYGRTCNPFNRDLTAGGSSGGESALIALFGSPLGIGTDIGGSIRLPAACTGLYGFKGSVARLPHAGLCGSHDGMDAIIGALGPIARSARDLALFCKTMLAFEPWLVEPPLLEIPWRQEIVEGKGIPAQLCFAILWDDHVVRPHPPILDALLRCRALLVAAGHAVIDWIPMDHKDAWTLITKLYFLDGGEEYEEVLSGEPLVPQTKWMMKHVPNGGKPFTVRETFLLNQQRETFRLKLAEHWNITKLRTGTGRPVDAILSPVAATLAPRHGATRWWGYTSYWNLADYPAAVFPVARYGTGGNDQCLTATIPLNADISTEMDYEELTPEPWDPDMHKGLPVCLQLIGRRLNEERVLGILNVVEKIMGQG